MNINTIFQEDHQVKLTVELDLQPFNEAKQQAARQIAKRIRIPGFRPGKAPYPIILRTVGESTVVQEAMDLLIEKLYPTILEEAKIKPYGPGTLSNILSYDPPTLEFVVPLEPTIALPEYHKIRLPYELQDITEEDVDQVLENFQDRSATFTRVERPAQEDDQVSLRLSAERKSPSDGQELTLIADRQTTLTITPADSEAKNEWPFSGFSRHLVGLSAGEEKTFEFTYPDDASIENFRGIEAIFRIKVESIKLRTLPALDDEFATSLGKYESLQALRNEIHTGLSEQRKNDYERNYQNRIIDEIIKEAQIQYPPQMLDRELEEYQNQLINRLSQQKMDLTTYLKTRQLDEEGLRAELKPVIEQRIRRSLVLVEVSRQENIRVDQQVVQKETVSNINQINEYYKPEEARRILTQDFIQNMVGNITSDLMVQATVQRLTSIARGDLDVEPSSAAETLVEEETEEPSTETAPQSVIETTSIESEDKPDH